MEIRCYKIDFVIEFRAAKKKVFIFLERFEYATETLFWLRLAWCLVTGVCVYGSCEQTEVMFWFI